MMNSRFLSPWERLQRGWRDWRHADGLPEVSPDLPPQDVARVEKLMDECLAARHGEVSARQHAATLGELYLTLDDTGRRHFLKLLTHRYSIEPKQVRQAAALFLTDEDEESFSRHAQALRKALVSPRQKLLRQFNALPQGVKFLIDMRSDLLRFVVDTAELKSLDDDLQQLLATWFDVGFLQVERITWQSSAALLEKLMAYEAVHAIDSWHELHHRLESDRHCYAFFHPVMPEEPLIFIEVALVQGLASSIQVLLDDELPEIDPHQADTAIFYSISNTQAGLKGISFGPFLIKRVVDSLRGSLPNLKTFATLSPLPGFRRWLDSLLREDALNGAENPLAEGLVEAAEWLGLAPDLGSVVDDPGWYNVPEAVEVLREPLLILGARYLHHRRSGDLAPCDPVARFHLGNGARIEQLNWLGDTSAKGMQESCGLMVNYLYRRDEMAQNIEAYATEKQIVASSRVRGLLREEGSGGPLGGIKRLLSASRSNETQ